MSEGIARGFVRPLSRVVYDAVDVPRALDLLASSNHRGRVVLRVHQKVLASQPRQESLFRTFSRTQCI